MKLSEARDSLREQYAETHLSLESSNIRQIDADLCVFRDLLTLLYGIGEDEEAVQEVYLEIRSEDGEVCPPLKAWFLLKGMLVSFISKSGDLVSHDAIPVGSITCLEAESNRENLTGHLIVRVAGGSSVKVLQPCECQVWDESGFRRRLYPCVNHFIDLYQALVDVSRK